LDCIEAVKRGQELAVERVRRPMRRSLTGQERPYGEVAVSGPSTALSTECSPSSNPFVPM
jgi:hypothetical protein